MRRPRAAAALLRRVLGAALRLQRVTLTLRALARRAVAHLDGPALRADERAGFDAALSRAVPDADRRAALVAQGAGASIEAACAAAVAMG